MESETEQSHHGDESGLGPEGPQHISRAAFKRAHSRGKYQAGRRLVAVLVLVLVLIVGGGASYWYWAGKPHVDENKSINRGEFQALFLTNGQVYFGKLANLNDKYVTITDVFYLQVQQSLQQAASTANTTTGQVSLAKLGNELHGPEDKMFVASDQVLFWENLRNNSKVTEAIDKYQSQ